MEGVGDREWDGRSGGLDVFLSYVKDYVSTFMGKSINDTTQWKDHDASKLLDQVERDVRSVIPG